MSQQKQVLIYKLKKHLEAFPVDSPEFLVVISEALKSYESTIEKKRNTAASQALAQTAILIDKISNSIFHKFDNETKIGILIDTVYYLFPESKPTNHSNGEIRLFEYFKDLCMQENVLTDDSYKAWLANVKGSEYYFWMQATLAQQEKL